MPTSSPRDPGPSAEVASLVERLGATFTAAGFPRLPARVFSLLLTEEDGRLGAGEIARVLRVSPASVSGAVGYLEGVRLIHREREPGSRRDIFVVRDDAWHDMLLDSARIYEPFVRVLAEGLSVVGGEATRAGARLRLSVEFLEFVIEETAGMVQRWEARQRTS